MNDKARPDPLQADALADRSGDGIRHGFFTRTGGVSEGIYRGLNVGIGSSDQPERVAENRARVAVWMGVGPGRLVTAYQVHSADVVVVEAPFDGDRPKVDAIVTKRPRLALGSLTADCGPVLFADADAGVVACAHAGWKGAFTGVLENTVSAMEKLGADRARIIAVLGPCIGAANYEVGPEFVERFTEAEAENERFFVPSPTTGHALFDLDAYIVARLSAAGVKAFSLGRCTYSDEDLFFSYRRTTHRGEPDYGRQISAIALED